MQRGTLFKNGLAVWLGVFGACVMLIPQTGVSEYVFQTVGSRAAVQSIGAAMIVCAGVGLLTRYSPTRLFFMGIPFGVYLSLALATLIQIRIEDPALLVILTGMFVLPLFHIIDELWRR